MIKNTIIAVMGIIILVVAFSGCNSTASQQKVVYEGDLGGSGTICNYIPVNASMVTVQISNTKVLDKSYASVALYALDVVGDNKQPTDNYVKNIVDNKDFMDLTKGYTANTTLEGNIKSVDVVTNDVKVHVRILA